MILLLKAMLHTLTIFLLALALTIVVLIVTKSAVLADLTFPVSIFLGILAFVIDELHKQQGGHPWRRK